jgi:adenylate cyclase class 2
MNNREIEAKFWIPGLPGMRQQLHTFGASLLTPRHLERNLRFDTPDRTLTGLGEVLRLREADVVSLTYKRSGESFEVRQEWEIEVHDFELAQGLLEGLGYEVFHRYEKYREVYKLDHCLVMLDEVPYSCFMEIEGPDLESIRSTAHKLHMNWEERIQQTYLDIFKALRESMDPKPTDATFKVFSNYPSVDVKQLNVPNADFPSGDEV